jgi:hypothetical protein
MGETRQACSKRGEASYLFIALGKATLFVAATGNARMREMELCAMGMDCIVCGVLCGTYGVKYSILDIVLWCGCIIYITINFCNRTALTSSFAGVY